MSGSSAATACSRRRLTVEVVLKGVTTSAKSPGGGRGAADAGATTFAASACSRRLPIRATGGHHRPRTRRVRSDGRPRRRASLTLFRRDRRGRCPNSRGSPARFITFAAVASEMSVSAERARVEQHRQRRIAGCCWSDRPSFRGLRASPQLSSARRRADRRRAPRSLPSDARPARPAVADLAGHSACELRPRGRAVRGVRAAVHERDVERAVRQATRLELRETTQAAEVQRTVEQHRAAGDVAGGVVELGSPRRRARGVPDLRRDAARDGESTCP